MQIETLQLKEFGCGHNSAVAARKEGRGGYSQPTALVHVKSVIYPVTAGWGLGARRGIGARNVTRDGIGVTESVSPLSGQTVIMVVTVPGLPPSLLLGSG